MNTIIYLTGKQGSGKSTLCALMRNALEINSNEIEAEEVEKQIWQNYNFFETVIITSQNKSLVYRSILKNFAKRNELKFHSIHLKKIKIK